VSSREYVGWSFSPEFIRSLSPDCLAALFPDGIGDEIVVEYERETVNGRTITNRKRTVKASEFASLSPDQKRALAAGDPRAFAKMTPYLRRAK
jgi:hypothetical protein